MLYSGIDLHKKTLAIHTGEAAGAMTRRADAPSLIHDRRTREMLEHTLRHVA